MAKKLEEGDEERRRYVETLGKYAKARTVVPPDCVRIERRPLEDIQKHLGTSLKSLVQQMYDCLNRGGELSRVDEHREDRRDVWKFHFDLWPELGGKEIFVETRFVVDDVDDVDDRQIFIVSVHPPDKASWT